MEVGDYRTGILLHKELIVYYVSGRGGLFHRCACPETYPQFELCLQIVTPPIMELAPPISVIFQY